MTSAVTLLAFGQFSKSIKVRVTLLHMFATFVESVSQLSQPWIITQRLSIQKGSLVTIVENTIAQILLVGSTLKGHMKYQSNSCVPSVTTKQLTKEAWTDTLTECTQSD